MKRFILSLILFSLCLAGIANEPVEVMVLMKARYDRTELCRRAEFYRTKAARRNYVVRELKAFAEASIQQIFDISGRIVDSDYDKLSPGIYLIQYRQGNQLKAKKILIR